MPLQIQFHLADLLRRHNITQKKLTEAADMRPATLNALVKGKTGRIEIGTLLYLDTSALARLYTREDGHERVAAEYHRNTGIVCHDILL